MAEKVSHLEMRYGLQMRRGVAKYKNPYNPEEYAYRSAYALEKGQEVALLPIFSQNPSLRIHVRIKKSNDPSAIQESYLIKAEYGMIAGMVRRVAPVRPKIAVYKQDETGSYVNTRVTYDDMHIQVGRSMTLFDKEGRLSQTEEISEVIFVENESLHASSAAYLRKQRQQEVDLTLLPQGN